MDSSPFLVSTLVNKDCFAKTLLDSGCLSYGLVSSAFATKNNLQRIPIPPRGLSGFDAPSSGKVTDVAVVSLDIDGHYEERSFLYIVPKLESYEMILGLPWINKQDARINGPKSECFIASTGTLVRNQASSLEPNGMLNIDCLPISIKAFRAITKNPRKRKIEVFAVSLKDIAKALAKTKKEKTDPRTKLPTTYWKFLKAFSPTDADKVPPLRGEGIDHKIELISENGKESTTVPWGPLYNMSYDELLVLRKTLTEYLDKGFIRVSNSPAAAPVLFVRKPGGGLRFCVDYRALNKVTRKDRYPLPLIQETLQRAGKAKWYTKLDVSQAFHRIRIAEGDEWKTAFRTRYGLYEWMVTPFGLANAPSTFQRYINHTLREYLDDFLSAYPHIDKCEFSVKRTKYLGFILDVNNGVEMDPEKVKAILEWQPPSSVKAVRSFLGFANFYRTFIRDYSDIVRPLTELTHKEQTFHWTDECQEVFTRLKEMFTTAPALVRFDKDKQTYDEQGLLRPCAFFSKKNSPAECNYEIYDKEMLAIIRCLEAWDPELRSVSEFEIRTDHKNLQYFMTIQKLTERQMRWSLVLSRYNFSITYIQGKDNVRADALSRRPQDMPDNADERVDYRTKQLLQIRQEPGRTARIIKAAPVQVSPVEQVNSDAEVTLEELWTKTEGDDDNLRQAREAVRQGQRTFPTPLKLKVSISECSLSPEGRLMFRNRLWVPQDERLRTRMIQDVHDSKLCGHPGRENTTQILSRQYFWPQMSNDVRRFVRNCDSCGRNKAWRDIRQGFLKPLPIPNRIWNEISIDFIVELPESNGCTNMVVITDRLGKGTICDGLKDTSAETVARWFIRTFYRRHYLPKAIVSDRGTQFVGQLWARLCQLLNIVRRLSTAFHPETDGSTERMNQIVETYLRMFVNHTQKDWEELLPLAELAINNRTATATKVSPFFLEHGYHAEPLDIQYDLANQKESFSPIQKADAIVRKLKDVQEWAQSAMATAQQTMEDITNRRRRQAPSFKVGDKVWLSLRNIRTTKQCKKLDAKQAKYTVIGIVGTHSYRLNTPPGIHNVFHSQLLRSVSSDPLPSQRQDDTQPGPEILKDNEEYTVEKILEEKTVRRGRGQQRKLLVKWKGYAKPTWEPYDALENASALDIWERCKEERTGGGGDNVTGYTRTKLGHMTCAHFA
ncbi:hypothetical protein DID88_006676 [Monilinia fructigena]|uniref:RNA-directed DNA polymerase n=1 Tax=Monilinia fructigena TaxID=38457 RepID=A0A395IGC8_9HELO|nr:hypothetical protein DID88_006676 [Monilinia fructigena]